MPFEHNPDSNFQPQSHQAYYELLDAIRLDPLESVVHGNLLPARYGNDFQGEFIYYNCYP